MCPQDYFISLDVFQCNESKPAESLGSFTFLPSDLKLSDEWDIWTLNSVYYYYPLKSRPKWIFFV